MAVLCVRSPEERHGPEVVDLLEAPLGHHSRSAGRGPHLGDRPVFVIRDRVALRNVDPGNRRQAVQQVLSSPGVDRRGSEGVAVCGDDLSDDLLALADHHEVHERRHGLRVREGAHAAHQDDGVRGLALLGPERDAGHPEEPEGVDVVPFVRDREPDQVELGKGSLGLQRKGPRAGSLVLGKVFGVRQEHALTDDVGQRVQMAVDGLKPEVGHPDRVGVGVDQRERDAAPPVLPDGAGLLREKAVSFFLETPRHAAYSLTDDGRGSKEGSAGGPDSCPVGWRPEPRSTHVRPCPRSGSP